MLIFQRIKRSCPPVPAVHTVVHTVNTVVPAINKVEHLITKFNYFFGQTIFVRNYFARAAIEARGDHAGSEASVGVISSRSL